MRRVILTAAALVLGLLAAGAARADDKDDVKALLDKGIKSLGGEEKLSKLKGATWKVKGKVYFGGNEIDYKGDFAMRVPDKYVAKIEGDFNGMTFQIASGVDGDKAWRKGFDGAINDLEGDELARERTQLFLQSAMTLLPLKAAGVALKPAGEEKVDGKPALALSVTPKGCKEVKIFLDKETGLVVKTVTKVKPPMSDDEVDQETVYGDYKEVGGIKRAMKAAATRGGEKAMEQTTSDFKPAEKVDDKLCEKP